MNNNKASDNVAQVADDAGADQSLVVEGKESASVGVVGESTKEESAEEEKKGKDEKQDTDAPPVEESKKRELEDDDKAPEQPSKKSKIEEEDPVTKVEKAVKDAADAAVKKDEAAADKNNEQAEKKGSEKKEKGSEDDGDNEEYEGKGLLPLKDDDDGPAPVPPSKEGTTIFGDNDVLSGRGGGTNVHPGNRNFRDLINLHRRAYLKARKNDKPAISRAIVRAVRESNGKFLRKDEKSGLWFEIGDDAAREKTSQALRQRAPEMRKLLFDTEREEARMSAHEHMRQQRVFMGMAPPEMMAAGNMPPGGVPMMMNPAMFAVAGGKNMPMPPNMPPGVSPEAYQQMFSAAAFMNGGMNRFAGSPPQQQQQQQHGSATTTSGGGESSGGGGGGMTDGGGGDATTTATV